MDTTHTYRSGAAARGAATWAAPGAAQRARIGAQMATLHWMTALGGLACAALFTALAAHHTEAVATNTSTQAQSTQQAQQATSSQGFFQTQSGTGVTSATTAPATSVGSSTFRTRTS